MTGPGDGTRSFPELFSGLAQIGRHAGGRGCTRLAWTRADRDAGTAALDDRRDPLLVLAAAIAGARERAAQLDCRATIGRTDVAPNGASTVERLGRRLAGTQGAVPRIPTAAGHDAAVLAAHVLAAMLFVRNPTGVSHSPAEHASAEDCLAGVRALTDVLEELIGT